MSADDRIQTPFVRASAVVGAEGFVGVVLGAVRLLTQRDIRSFPDRASAIAWPTGL